MYKYINVLQLCVCVSMSHPRIPIALRWCVMIIHDLMNNSLRY